MQQESLLETNPRDNVSFRDVSVTHQASYMSVTTVEKYISGNMIFTTENMNERLHQFFLKPTVLNRPGVAVAVLFITDVPQESWN